MDFKKTVLIVVLLGVFISTFWYTAGYIHSLHPPMAEPDAFIYLQYARSMATGHPFEFVPGDTPSTGCTSYLYPALLALLYKIGITGNAFLNASFALNAVLYLCSVLLVGLISRKLAPKFYLYPLLATALGGQTLYTFFGQTDMGLFLTLMLFCFWAFLTKRNQLLLVGVILTGLSHPTAAAPAAGLLISGTLFFFLQHGTIRHKLASPACRPLWIGAAGVTAIALTLLFNYLLTGNFVFMSLRFKGLFKMYPLPGALNITIFNLVTLIKEVFFGLSTNGNYRALYFFPLLTGLAATAGLLTRKWHTPESIRFDSFVVPTILAELLLVSTNAQIGISYDRYMAWVTPLIYIYAAVFLQFISTKQTVQRAAIPLTVALTGFQLISFCFFSAAFTMATDLKAIRPGFAEEILEKTRDNDCFLMESSSGGIWHLPNRRLFHPAGIFTPATAKGRHWLCYVETLKYHPELRPDYLLISDAGRQTDPVYPHISGTPIAEETDNLNPEHNYSLYAADWRCLDPAPPAVPPEWGLRDRLDIGFHEDETRTGYRTSVRLRATKVPPHIKYDPDQNKMETGQLVLGSERFQASHIIPKRPLHIILRTAKEMDCTVYRHHTAKTRNFQFSSVITLNLLVDGTAVETSVQLADRGFCDVQLTIPAELIKRSDPVIEVDGDHLSYAYWFFQ
jgi:hypothetical protein